MHWVHYNYTGTRTGSVKLRTDSNITPTGQHAFPCNSSIQPFISSLTSFHLLLHQIRPSLRAAPSYPATWITRSVQEFSYMRMKTEAKITRNLLVHLERTRRPSISFALRLKIAFLTNPSKRRRFSAGQYWKVIKAIRSSVMLSYVVLRGFFFFGVIWM